MDHVISAFLEYGLLGVVCLVALWFALKKDREAKALSEEKDELHKHYSERMEKQATDTKSEIIALEERYITKAETWMQQYHANAGAQTEALAELAGLIADFERTRKAARNSHE